MREEACKNYIILKDPLEIRGITAFWNFSRIDEALKSTGRNPLKLLKSSPHIEFADAPDAPFGKRVLRLKEGQWLHVPGEKTSDLDFSGEKAAFSLVAWIKREEKSSRECEFIAGKWNESQRGRQYGLFLNIHVWNRTDQICGHLSSRGGPTDGYKYCMDGPVGSTAVPYGEWVCAAMTYDGISGYVWIDGNLDFRAGLNPYSIAGGLNRSEFQSDFTVGAVDRAGEMGNFFKGDIAGIAVYDRALTPAEIYALNSLSAAEMK